VFICLDGVDGAGKTTQARMLFQRFQKQNQPAELVADPGTTQIGKAIRHILLDTDAPITAAAQMLLFSAARAELADYIRQRLAENITIICDRWLLSTLVYQADVNGVDEQLIFDIFRATACQVPDIYVVLDVEPETAYSRVTARPHQDRYERRCLEHFKTLRQHYTERAVNLGALLPDVQLFDMYFLRAEKSAESLHEDIYTLCQQHVFSRRSQ